MADDVDTVSREELHFRRIDMRGWRRSDGLFEVEARLVDRKPDAPAPLHDLGVRIVFDARFTVHDVHTITDAAPYAACPEGGRALASLIGLRMVGGWSAQVRERLAGARSCTHLMQLLMPLATVAFQSLGPLQRDDPQPLDRMGRPLKIDSCFAYAAQGDLVRARWPEFHRPPSPQGESQ